MPTTAVETITGAESAERAGITIRNPRTGDVLWTVPEAGPEAAARAVDVARSAAPDWAATAPSDRGAALRGADARLAVSSAFVSIARRGPAVGTRTRWSSPMPEIQMARSIDVWT